MSERLETAPSALTGMWGELAVVTTLRRAGWGVDWDGGMTRHRDLRTTSPSGCSVHLQVKTSTTADGRIVWKKSGDPARDWAQSVEEGGTYAFYVFAHFPTPAEVHLDSEAGSLTVVMPRDFVLTACAAREFADDVDEARREYGSRIRQRNDRFGTAGESLDPDGLQYPVLARDYKSLDEIIAALAS